MTPEEKIAFVLTVGVIVAVPVVAGLSVSAPVSGPTTVLILAPAGL
jgi:hypothetical protein